MTEAGGTGSRLWVRREDVLWRRTLDSVVLLRPGSESGDPVVVSGGGPSVWDLLDEPRSLDDLVATLSRRFDATPEAVASDVEALLADLEDRGLVRRGG